MTAWSHLSDLDWNRPGEQVIEEFNKGDVVKAVVLDVDVEKERISLGIKQLGKDAVGEAAASGDLRKNAVVSCEVIAINDGGIEVKLVNHEDITSFIRRADLSRDRDEQRPERFSVGQAVDARVTNFSKKDRKIMLSIKALEIAEEKEAVAQFGSSDSGRFARRHPRRGSEEPRRRIIASLRLEEQKPAGAIRRVLCLCRCRRGLWLFPVDLAPVERIGFVHARSHWQGRRRTVRRCPSLDLAFPSGHHGGFIIRDDIGLAIIRGIALLGILLRRPRRRCGLRDTSSRAPLSSASSLENS